MPSVIVNKEFVTNILVDVFNNEKYTDALSKLLTKTFDEYRKYLEANPQEEMEMERGKGKGKGKRKKRSDRYVVYKVNVLQELIAQSDSKQLLNMWDKNVIKLKKR